MRRLLAVLIGCGFIAAAPRAQTHPVPLVDYHQHLFGPATVSRSPNLPAVSSRDLVRLLDDAGIQRAVVLSIAYQYSNPNNPPVADEYAKVRAENDWTGAEVGVFPDRLIGFCSVNPLRPYALDEIDRCAENRYLRFGLKLHFGNSDVDLDQPTHVAAVRRVFASANRHGMAVVVHLRASVTKQRPYGTRQAQAFLDKVLPAAPDVVVQIAHLAGAGSYDEPTDAALGVFADAFAHGDPRVARLYVDVSGVAGLGDWRPYAERIAGRLRQIGLSRILYGSDGAGDAESAPSRRLDAFWQLPLTASEFRTIAGNIAPYLPPAVSLTAAHAPARRAASR